MKTVLLSLAFLMSFNLATSQVGDVEVREEPVLVGTGHRNQRYLPKLQYQNTSEGRYYILSYLNAEYPNLNDAKVVGFFATEDDIEYVYDFLKGGYDNDEDRSLKVGEDVIRTEKTVSKKSIIVFVDHKDEPSGFFYLTTKQLDRLFGKAD
ncbi:hypothetical protein [Flagellimonas profundi]|uniref:Uncharacterized protein n=1 Tax=Flagellimonas profundi TaxID=2915620 RepID=A0ABS3FCP4_9FLAO|nr:hypothetical protein [Allomuricauda profundi]MBO0340937.1 hypothetical protein [Allomuricauda profundi]